jgi:hypothetical protein
MKQSCLRFVLSIAILSLIGSRSQAQWVQMNGSFPGSGNVTALAVGGTSLFAGSSGSASSGGEYVSTDNGASWAGPDANLGNPYIHAFAVSTSYLFAATDIGVYRLANNGTVWTFVNSGIINRSIEALAISGTNLFAGTLGGVYLSTDNGTSWTAVNSGLTNSSVQAFGVIGTNIFVGTGGGAFLSTNNGTGWTAINSGLTNSSVQAFAVIGTNIFAGTGGGVFLSTNNGTGWTAVNSGLTKSILALAVSGTSLFAGTLNSGVYFSTNSGANWIAVNSGLSSTVYSLAVGGTNLFAGARGGVWRRPLSEMVTSVQAPSSQLPDAFELKQNYPNPFNPSTTISFSVPSKSFVTLRVFDNLGREMSTLVAEELSVGIYSRHWDAANVPSGIYFYRLQAGEYLESRKMILLK